ncbi:MAG: DUF3107 domain-containing protein [Actinobacteria bacterium]|nr:DUF3107 domain-containing protein [Actinomycetota bacterium]MBO0786446.1 DUF3107 domain-containing protein [Actinomycetota bacterium]MBO0818190.1 DUF3107 domain-containing protein [Actinomycetota bacterium]
MEVKIGIQSIPREIVVETTATADEVERLLSAAVTDGGLFALADGKGGKLLVPADKIAYVEFGGNETRRVGFGTTVSGPYP